MPAKRARSPLADGVDLITDIWSDQPGDFFCISTKAENGKWNDRFFATNELDRVEQYVRDHQDCDVYFCPHGFSKPKRRKEFAALPRLLWADLDEADPETVKYRPTIAFQSSPGRFTGLWETDGPVTEELNQRMTRAAGADPSGWDSTQVLRMPGTCNYKYSEQPPVSVLWEDGPDYRVTTLERQLPKQIKQKADVSGEINHNHHKASDVLKRYEKQLPQDVRQLIHAERVEEPDRSKCIFKIVASLDKADASPDEIAAVLWHNIYFTEKHGHDEGRLEAEINRCLAKLETDAPKSCIGDVLVNLSEVEPLTVDWLWKPFIPYGMVSILEGDPGEGKSFLAMHIASQVSIGGSLPGKRKLKQGKVVYLTAEDDPAYTVRPRIDSMGGDPTQMLVQQDFLSLDDKGWEQLSQAVEDWKPKLIVVDPLFAYVPAGQDMYKPNVIRALLSRFKSLAEKTGAAVLVIRHLTKTKHEKAIYQGGGSVDVIGAARSAIRVIKNPDDPTERLVLHIKHNISERGQSWAYKLEAKGGRKVPEFRWVGPSSLTIDDIMAGERGEEASALDRAVEYLRDELKDGPKPTKVVEDHAERHSISKRTLDRARQTLGIRPQKTKSGWQLALPEKQVSSSA
jgi:hypothetical protein